MGARASTAGGRARTLSAGSGGPPDLLRAGAPERQRARSLSSVPDAPQDQPDDEDEEARPPLTPHPHTPLNGAQHPHQHQLPYPHHLPHQHAHRVLAAHSLPAHIWSLHGTSIQTIRALTFHSNLYRTHKAIRLFFVSICNFRYTFQYNPFVLVHKSDFNFYHFFVLNR